MNTQNSRKKTLKITILLLLVSIIGFHPPAKAQVLKPFTQRTSIYSPDRKIYHIKGDFTIIGNTNLTPLIYSEHGNNSFSNMVFVDIDGDANTINSSSAELTFSTERGADPECSKILFAGLYWSGRNNSSSMTISYGGKTYAKNQVKFKHENGSYQTITAHENDILFQARDYDDIYVAYAEVTDIVRQYGLGNYYVADMALTPGDGGRVGYFGGWGLVVVYENSVMRWRDVTIFDGYSYVSGDNYASANVNLPISGFKAVQVGRVDIKLGFMAGEGDYGISGDRMYIAKQTGGVPDGTYYNIPNPRTGATDNFFNSSIVTEGNMRNPNRNNNYGLDIYMFNLDNDDKSIITNEQTETVLRFTTSTYGFSRDTYTPFFLAMSVNAYIPEAEALSAVIDLPESSYDESLNTYVINPGDEVIFNVKVKNIGTEDIINAKVEIPLPVTIVHYSTGQKDIYPGLTVDNYFDATRGINGTAGWTIDYLPAGDLEQEYATLVLTCKVTDDCYVLASTEPECKLELLVNGTLEGWSYVNGVYFKKESFIQGFVDDGSHCQGVAIRDDIRVVVDRETHLLQGHCSDGDYTVRNLEFCSSFYPGGILPFGEIYRYYPLGTRFFNTVTGDEYTITTGFPLALLEGVTIDAVAPSVGGGNCTSQLLLNSVSDDTWMAPTFDPSHYTYCFGDTPTPLSLGVTLHSSNLYARYYMRNDGTAPGLTDIIPSTDVEGNYTYYVRQFLKNSLGCEDPTYYPITVQVESPITFSTSHAIPSCIGITVTITGEPSGGSWSYDASLSEHIQVSGNVLTILGSMPAGDVVASYTHTTHGSTICPSIVKRTYTHTIAAETIAGILSEDQTLCVGSQIQPLIITGNSGHVERWEQRIGASGEWAWIPNNTTSLSTADLGDLSIGNYFYRALVKDGNCEATYTNEVKITVTNEMAPAALTYTTPQYTCPNTSYMIAVPSGSYHYHWYEHEIGGIADASLQTVQMQLANIARYVSHYDEVTECQSARTLIVVKSNFKPGSIIKGSQTECTIGMSAHTIGSETDAIVLDGTGTVQYQWFVSVDGAEATAIDGATAATYTPIPFMDEEHVYVFTRKAKNSACSDWIASFNSWTLTIGVPDATITAVPANAVVCGGSGVKLTLSAAGPSTKYYYQWYKDGVAVIGATARTYSTIEPGTYTAKVTHKQSGCESTTSAADAIEVTVDNQAPTVPDNQTTELTTCDLIVLPKAYYTVAEIETGFEVSISDDKTSKENLTVSVTEDTISYTLPFVVERTYTITDECDKSSFFKHTIRIQRKPSLSSSSITITCPPDIFDTLAFGDCVRRVNPEKLGAPTITPYQPYLITNDIPADSLYHEGDNLITWIITDEVCGQADTCYQHVNIVFPQCPDAVDCEGNVYQSVRIGCDCWTRRNLESTKYSDCTDIPCVYEYVSYEHPNVTENVDRYGRLYCYEAAIRDSADNGHGHIQGICPEGWYLPTPEKYDELNTYGADALKSPLYWTSGGGDNSTGFSALPAGFYNGSTLRFEGMLGETYFWSTANVGSNISASVFHLFLNCDRLIETDYNSGWGYSVRCIKEKE